MSDLDATAPQIAIEAVDLWKSYLGGDGRRLEVLRGVNLQVYRGETVAIIGQSGSGKSTLLHVLGGLDRPSAGSVRLGGQPVHDLSEDEAGLLRNQRIGFVFQFHHLLREFTVLENVMMPLFIAKMSRKGARDRARSLLVDVGLEGRLDHKPSQLSGGEQQRVAVARALANQPVALLADEPSGNLDPETSDMLHALLFDVAERHRTAMVLVTHNMRLASQCARVLEMQSGSLVPAASERYEYAKRTAI
jgi:lipoprotein-releasing system ATP-binding protein